MKLALPKRLTIQLKHRQEENVVFRDEKILTDTSKLESMHKSKVYETLRHTHTPSI
jgi:hypothetical protein